MPKEAHQNMLKDQLATHGLSLCKVDGEWQVKETPGGLTGLPCKLRAIKLHVRFKPPCCPGRSGEVGHNNIQEKLKMSVANYQGIDADAKTIVERTPLIDTTVGASLQPHRAINLTVQK
ncbi:hypothetical protein FRC06_001233, partial [Ceratobasidium sp. 370]